MNRPIAGTSISKARRAVIERDVRVLRWREQGLVDAWCVERAERVVETGERITLEEWAGLRKNSYEREFLKEYVDVRALVSAMRYARENSKRLTREVPLTYDEALVHSYSRIAERRLLELSGLTERDVPPLDAVVAGRQVPPRMDDTLYQRFVQGAIAGALLKAESLRLTAVEAQEQGARMKASQLYFEAARAAWFDDALVERLEALSVVEMAHAALLLDKERGQPVVATLSERSAKAESEGRALLLSDCGEVMKVLTSIFFKKASDLAAEGAMAEPAEAQRLYAEAAELVWFDGGRREMCVAKAKAAELKSAAGVMEGAPADAVVDTDALYDDDDDGRGGGDD